MMPAHEGHCSGSECPRCWPYLDRVGAAAPWTDSRGLPCSAPNLGYPRASTTVIIAGHPLEGPNPLEHIVIHQRRDNGWWGLIGGGQDEGESIEECARREAWEETGLEVTLQRLVCVDSDPRQHAINVYRTGEIVQYTNLTFLATVSKGALLRPSAESLQVHWARSDKLPRPWLPAHQWRLDQALAGREGVVVR